MAGEQDNLGDISIGVGGDLSPLEQALLDIGPVAETAASNINEALGSTGGVDALTTSVGKAAEAMSGEFAASVGKAADQLSRVPDAANAAAGATESDAQATQTLSGQLDTMIGLLTQAVSSLDAVAQSESRMAAATEEAAQGMAKVNEAISHAKEVAEAFVAIGFAEKLGELARETIQAYGQQERLATSFQIMSGSAQAAADQLKVIDDMSVRLGLDQSELEHSAQRLAVTFGVGAGLTGVMTAAANVSAVTGQSFDSVASSLERVQLTGQVSARQLVALKLSWEDLAKSMGVSVEEAQAKLKKGGQDAAADVQALLDTIKSKYGDAAALQAQGIIGQIRSLTSQIESLMEDAGKTIAQPVADIVAVIRNTVIPAVKALVETFDSLPGPIKEGAVIVGALAVALVPLAGLLAAVGFAIQGVETLASRLPEIFTRATVSTEALAAADVQLTGASTAASAAMVRQETAAIGLAGAQSTAASALTGTAAAGEGAALTMASVGTGLTMVAAAAAAVGASLFLIHFTGLDEDLKTLVTELNGASTALGDAKGALGNLATEVLNATPGLTELRDAWNTTSHAIGELGPAQFVAAITGLDKIKTGVTLLTGAVDMLSNHWGSMDEGNRKLLASLQPTQAALAGVSAGDLEAANSAEAYKRKVQELTDAWNKAGAVVDELARQEAAGKDVQEALTLAEIDAQKAGAALTQGINEHIKAVKDNVLSLGALQTKAGEAASALDRARVVYEQAVAAFKAGKATQDVVNDAWVQLAKAAKDAHEPLSNLQHDIETLKAKVDTQITSLVAARDEYGQLKAAGDKTISGQLALAEALKGVENQAKNLGLSVDVVGGKLEFGLADKAGKAAAGIQLLADQMNQVYGPTEKAGVIINGQFVPVMQNLTDKTKTSDSALQDWVTTVKNVPGAAGDASHSIDVLRGTANNAVSAVSDLNDVHVMLNNTWTTAAELQTRLNTELHDQAVAAEEAAKAVTDLADAWDEEGDSASSASNKSGKGGKGGGGMSGTSYLEDLYSLATNPLSTVGGNFSGNDIQNIAQALKRMLGIEDQFDSGMSAGDIIGQFAGKKPGSSNTGSIVSSAASLTDSLGKVGSAADNIAHDIGFAGNTIITAATDAANGLTDAYTNADKAIVTAGGTISSGVALALGPVISTAIAAASTIQSLQAMAANVATLGSQQKAQANTMGDAGTVNRGLPPISITTNVQAGVVAGSNGMEQLSAMIGDKITTQLRQVAGLKL